MRTFPVFPALTFALLLPSLVTAQQVRFDAFTGATAPAGAILEDERQFGDSPAPAWGIAMALEFFPGTALVGGFSRHEFGCEPDCTLTGNGLDVGLRYQVPMAGRLLPGFSAGGVFHTLQLRDLGADARTRYFVTHTSPGFYAGAELGFRVMEILAVVPQVRYIRYGARTREGDDIGTLIPEVDHTPSYFLFQLGVRLNP
jgi:hypothetical protein